MAASLTLRGKIVKATLDLKTEAMPEGPWTYNLFRRLSTTAHLVCGDEKRNVSPPFFDLIVHSKDAVSFHEQVLCIAVHEDRCSTKTLDLPLWQMAILILGQCRSDSPRYKRIGIFLLEGEDLEFYTSHETEEEHSITII